MRYGGVRIGEYNFGAVVNVVHTGLVEAEVALLVRLLGAAQPRMQKHYYVYDYKANSEHAPMQAFTFHSINKNREFLG